MVSMENLCLCKYGKPACGISAQSFYCGDGHYVCCMLAGGGLTWPVSDILFDRCWFLKRHT